MVKCYIIMNYIKLFMDFFLLFILTTFGTTKTNNHE